MKGTTRTIRGLAGCLILMGASAAWAADEATNALDAQRGEAQRQAERLGDAVESGRANLDRALESTQEGVQPILERDKAMKAEKRGEAITVTGRAVDLTSYMTDGEVTSFDPAKVRAGEAPLVGLLTDDNKVHLILNCDQNSEFMSALRTQSGERLTVSGHLMTRGGLSAIKVKSAGTEAAADSTGNVINTTVPRSATGDAGSSSGDPNAHNDGSHVDPNIKDVGPASTNNPAIERQ